MPSSTLSAETIVAPRYFTSPDYAQTLGPEVCDLVAMANFPADPEQRMLHDAAFGLDKHGKLTAFEVAVIACRQNLKTGFKKQQNLGKVFLMNRPLVVWSAHEFNTTKEAFRDLCILIESAPELDRRVQKILRGNGDESIELTRGQRIVFRARTKTGGKGLAGDDVGLDEAFALMPEHIGSLMPVLSTRRNAQITYGSSAGYATSEILRGVRDRGRRKGGSRRLVYAEWTAERVDADGNALPPDCLREDCRHGADAEGCILDDNDRIIEANPQAGRRIGWDYLDSERDSMRATEGGAREYLRERMGYWDAAGSSNDPPALDADAWSALGDPAAPKPKRFWVYLHSSPDGSRTTMALAGETSGRRRLVLTTTRAGDAWVVKRLKRMTKRGGVAGVALNTRTQAGSLVTKLKAAGVDFVDVTSAEAGQATLGMKRAVNDDGSVVHVGQAELDVAVAEARTRRFDEGERFDQRDPDGPDISPLIAAAGALHRWATEGDYDVEDSYL